MGKHKDPRPVTHIKYYSLSTYAACGAISISLHAVTPGTRGNFKLCKNCKKAVHKALEEIGFYRGEAE